MSAARQLQLAKRENFFSDPLFKDIWSFEDGDLQKRLETFKNKSALAIPGKADTAHNLQVRIAFINSKSLNILLITCQESIIIIFLL